MAPDVNTSYPYYGNTLNYAHAGYGHAALSFLSDESAICAHIVEKEYGGLRMKTPDVEFKVGWLTLKGSAKRWSLGCVNAAGRLIQKWLARAGTKFTKPDGSILAEPCSQ